MADNNDKTPNANDADNPHIVVTANQSKTEAYNTHGGAQKSEQHYKAIVQKSARDGDQATYRGGKGRK
jgi:hypothetical protein